MSQLGLGCVKTQRRCDNENKHSTMRRFWPSKLRGLARLQLISENYSRCLSIFLSFHTARVKTGKDQCEHVFSALPAESGHRAMQSACPFRAKEATSNASRRPQAKSSCQWRGR
jgi:hypothetical protein